MKKLNFPGMFVRRPAGKPFVETENFVLSADDVKPLEIKPGTICKDIRV